MLNLKCIKYQIHDDGIAFINLNRNPVNAFNLILLEELDKVINDIKDNSKCKLIIFRSLQKHFSAGADLAERKMMSKKTTLSFLEKINKLFNDIEDLNIPTIASINGAALGGGLELALCCDFRIATQNSISCMCGRTFVVELLFSPSLVSAPYPVSSALFVGAEHWPVDAS